MKPHTRNFLIAALIGTIVAFTTNESPPDAIITGLVTFLLWYAILYAATHLPRRTCLLIAALIAAGAIAIFLVLSWPTIFPPKPTPTPYIIIITATPSPVP